MTKKPDRRIGRTRALLQDALFALIVEKGYEQTTVQDIIDRANVGRSTFYAHFADKETLLVSRLEDMRAELKREQARIREAAGVSGGPRFGFSLAMLQHARSNWSVHQALQKRRGGSLLLPRLQRMLIDVIADDLRQMGLRGPPARRALVTEYVAGAFMGVLAWWLERAPSLTPEAVDARFRELVMRGVSAELTS